MVILVEVEMVIVMVMEIVIMEVWMMACLW